MKTIKKHPLDNQLSITDDLNNYDCIGEIISPTLAKEEIERIKLLEKVIDKDYIIRVEMPKNDLTGRAKSSRLIRAKHLTDLLTEKDKISLLEKVFKGEADKYTKKIRKGATIKISVR